MAKLEKLKSMIPLNSLEWSAQQQIYDALELDFLKTLAIMPDCHTGYLLPIGGVALLEGVISPEYVGYDIGCGMCCCVTDMKEEDLGDWNDKIGIFDRIYKRIPIGVGQSKTTPEDYKDFESAIGNKVLDQKVNSKLTIQLGTLGSGNHFIEIGKNRNNNIVITIHSGSRNIGHSIAAYYMQMTKHEDTHLPKGFLDLNSGFGKAYEEDMRFALQYALDNRMIMMISTLDILGYNARQMVPILKNVINENHNHAVITPDGVLHRKGATPAEKGVLGVIPGTMKSGVYITTGLGNEEFLNSASHGAGRRLGRKAAKKAINIEDHKKSMEGIVAKVDESTLDEAHKAYKNLASVIGHQEGIVIDVVDYVRPLINVKG
jgi:tRNA-splicing ligase RtcB (3'-phosphate/5'-hydroxy nucleic acid ligase)